MVPCVIANIDFIDLYACSLFCNKIYTDVSRCIGRKVSQCQTAVCSGIIIFIAKYRNIVAAVVIIGCISRRNAFGVRLVPKRN